MIDRREIYLPLLGCVLFGVTLLVELRGADEPTVTDVLPLGAIVAAVPGEQRARVDELLATAL